MDELDEVIDEIDTIAPGLRQDLREAIGWAEDHAGEQRIDRRIAAAKVRTSLVAAVMDARASRRIEAATKRLSAATWFLAFSTVALVLATIGVIVVTAAE